MRIVLVHLEISAFILIRHSRICLFVLQQEYSVSFLVKLKCGCSKYDLKITYLILPIIVSLKAIVFNELTAQFALFVLIQLN